MSEQVNIPSTMLMFEEEVVERRLAFKPDPELNNLCMGVINEIRIDTRVTPTINEDGTDNTWEYAGLEVPTLVIEFKQCKTAENPKDRYYTFTSKPVTTMTKDGMAVDPATVTNIVMQEYAKLRHIANQFKGLKEYPTNTKCPGIDIAAPAKTRIEQYKAFYEYFVDLFTGTGATPMYKAHRFWMKLVANYKTGKYLEFPQFVGRGFIERVVEKQNPTLEFEANETVVLNKDSKAGAREKAAGAPAPMGAESVSEDVKSILEKYA